MSVRRRDPLTGTWRSFPPAAPLADGTQGCEACRLRGDADDSSFRVHVVDASPPPAVGLPPVQPTIEGPYETGPAAGAAELVLYGGHEVSLDQLDAGALARLLEVCADRFAVLARRSDVLGIAVHEERSTADGHPALRIDGRPELSPTELLAFAAARAHLAREGTCPGCDVVAQERAEGLRVVARNRTALAHVPFAPARPYEVHVTSHRHATSLLDLSDPEREDLAALVQVVLAALRGHLGAGAGYTLSVEQSPADDGGYLDVAHLRVVLGPASPPAGAEQVLPEEAAAALRVASG